MTEKEWLECDDPRKAIATLRKKGPADRKLRLLACSCCRHLQSSVTSDAFSQCVEISENYAEGKGTKAALKRGRQSTRKERHAIPSGNTEFHLQWVALWLAEVTASENAAAGVSEEIQRLTTQGLLPLDMQPPWQLYLRDIFGNPFRPVALDQRWLTSTVVDLAGAIYQERAFDKMPILANALMDAGCDSDEMLNHCRSDGPHVRGCWVVDLLLGKE